MIVIEIFSIENDCYRKFFYRKCLVSKFFLSKMIVIEICSIENDCLRNFSIENYCYRKFFYTK